MWGSGKDRKEALSQPGWDCVHLLLGLHSSPSTRRGHLQGRKPLQPPLAASRYLHQLQQEPGEETWTGTPAVQWGCDPSWGFHLLTSVKPQPQSISHDGFRWQSDVPPLERGFWCTARSIPWEPRATRYLRAGQTHRSLGNCRRASRRGRDGKEASPEWESVFLPTLNSKGAVSVETAERRRGLRFPSAPGIASAKRAGLHYFFFKKY